MSLEQVHGRLVRRGEPIPYPGNDREFIIDPTFERCYSAPEEWNWEVLPGPGATAVQLEGGYAPLVTWTAAAAGAEVVLRGAIMADLAGYAALRVRVMAGSTDTVAVQAEVDGRLVAVAAPAPGVDDYGEYPGPVSGQRLTAVEVRCRAGQAGPMTSSVMWVMLVKPGTPTPFPQPDPQWPGLLRRAPRGPRQPELGLFFDAAGLATLRQLVHQPAWTTSWAKAVAQAEVFAQQVPEATANPVIPAFKGRYGRPDVRDDDPQGGVIHLALVGLLAERADLLEVAARWALTWTRCRRWVQYGLECLPGLPFHHGRFVQAGTATAAALVLDWCGSCLTRRGQAALAQAIHDLGVVDIDGIMQPGSYVWGMNQGIVFESGRFLGAYAVRNWYPEEYPRREAEARQMLNACLPTSMLPDGAGTEGCGYWVYTMDSAVLLIAALARASGQTVREVTPAVAAASGRWALVNRRTDTDELLTLPHADGGYDHGISPLLQAFFAGPLGMPEYQPLAATAAASISIRQLPVLAAFGPPAAPPGPPPAPALLTVFPAAGQVDVRQADARAGLRLYFFSGPRCGHCHDDKNSFILEAYGQTLLLDRGTPSYTHPAITVSKLSDAHNTVGPRGITQTVAPGAGGAVLRRAEAVGDQVVIESDAAGCWPGLGRRVVRRVVHWRPATLIVEDDVEWAAPQATEQYWQSLGEWRTEDGQYVTTVGGVELGVRILVAAGATVSSGPYSVDGKLRPVQRLVISSPVATTARFVVLLQVRPNRTAPWPCEVVGGSSPEQLQLRQTGGLHLFFDWRAAGLGLGK